MLELKELEKLLRRGSAVELDPRLKQGAMGAIETKSRTKSACKVAGGDGDSDSDGDGDGDSAFLTGVDGGGGGEVGAAAAAPMKGSRSLPILRSSIGRQVVSEYSTARIVIFSTTHRWPRPFIEKRPSPGILPSYHPLALALAQAVHREAAELRRLRALTLALTPTPT